MISIMTYKKKEKEKKVGQSRWMEITTDQCSFVSVIDSRQMRQTGRQTDIWRCLSVQYFGIAVLQKGGKVFQ